MSFASACVAAIAAMGVPAREQLREKDWFYQFFSFLMVFK